MSRDGVTPNRLDFLTSLSRALLLVAIPLTTYGLITVHVSLNQPIEPSLNGLSDYVERVRYCAHVLYVNAAVWGLIGFSMVPLLHPRAMPPVKDIEPSP